MAANDPMTIDERRKYLFGMQKRYRGATRQERAGLLDEMAKAHQAARKDLFDRMEKLRGELDDLRMDSAPWRFGYEAWE